MRSRAPTTNEAGSTQQDEADLTALMDEPQAMARMRAAFDLFDLAVAIQRQNLRRRHPDASLEEIGSLLNAWLLHRPGAEHGDASGPDFRSSSRFADLHGRADRTGSE